MKRITATEITGLVSLGVLALLLTISFALYVDNRYRAEYKNITEYQAKAREYIKDNCKGSSSFEKHTEDEAKTIAYKCVTEKPLLLDIDPSRYAWERAMPLRIDTIFSITLFKVTILIIALTCIAGIAALIGFYNKHFPDGLPFTKSKAS